MQKYRGITLMSVTVVVYNRMKLDRIYGPVNQILRPNQAGFGNGMSCLQQIHLLRRIMEGARDKNLPLVTTFVDFTKAFDLVERSTMWKFLRAYCIPERIVGAIKCIYNGSNNRVRLSGQLREPYNVTTVVL